MQNEEMRNRPPLWREPIFIGIAMVVLVAALGVVYQDRILPNPVDKSALPAAGGGGGFCDIPSPVKSTAYNPSTRRAE